MDRRNAKRITVGYKTEILYDNKSYTGTMENLSASGVNILTDPLVPGIDFLPDDPIVLVFKSPSDEALTLKCTIIWSSKIPPQNVRHRIGMEIDELPWEKAGEFF
ncbi:MAG: PilZ domain-containing protein [Nitrospirae bacterium]|nr:PilZ domain-containing protein [Nitrospirota bacterium]